MAIKSTVPTLDIYSGDDITAYEWMRRGAKGVISVTANVAPKLMAQWCDAIINNEPTVAKTIHHSLLPLHKALFLESNPIPVKWALHKMGWIAPDIRLPLTYLSAHHHESLAKILTTLGIL